MITFADDHARTLKRCLVHDESGRVTNATMRDRDRHIDREMAVMTVLVTLEASTGPMRREAVETGTYRSPGWGRDFPRVQILTIAELLAGQEVNVPPIQQTFARAGRIRAGDGHRQAGFLDPEPAGE